MKNTALEHQYKTRKPNRTEVNNGYKGRLHS